MKGKKTGGRKKGTPNKAATVRENTLAVFAQIGGVETMAEWARENQTEFYKLYGRMAPSDPDALGGVANPMRHSVSVEFVGTAPRRV